MWRIHLFINPLEYAYVEEKADRKDVAFALQKLYVKDAEI